MSEKLDAVNVTSGISVAGLGESNKGVSGGSMVGGSKSKTLGESSSEKGVLSDGVRVSEDESKALVGELDRGNGISGVVVEPGNIGIDASRNRAVAMMAAQEDDWESWGVLNMARRMLNGQCCMDADEVEDVGNFKNGREVNSVSGMNTWQGAIGESSSANNYKGTEIDKDSNKLDSGNPKEGTYLNGIKDSVASELVPRGGKSAIEEVNDVRSDAVLIPKKRGENCITEKEGEYYVSDLVWGKVRSHPWWPGQIFSPQAASDKAARHFKSHNYLIAYFGDRSFAWNEKPKIKPFRKHFSQMEKQSNADGFVHAVDCALAEVTRRVEFGLSCPCLPKEVRDKVRFQVVENGGIDDGSSMRIGGDNLSTAASFSPGELLRFLGSVAKSPLTKTNRLVLETKKAQVVAFNRWKGDYHYKLPVFEDGGMLLMEESTQGLVLPDEEKSVGVNKSNQSRKRKLTDKSEAKRHEKEKDVVCPSSPEEELDLRLPSADTMFSKLVAASKNPVQEYVNMIPVVGLLRGFRNSNCLEHSDAALRKLKGKEPLDSKTTPRNFEDSYWTDRVIESSSAQDQVMTEFTLPEKIAEVEEDNNNNNNNNKKERDDVIVIESDGDQEPEEEEPLPIALILNFNSLDTIPSIPRLNEIFRPYGPLFESETVILPKSKRVKVIFKRPDDANTAFSSACKYSVFGPSLVSYRLMYVPKLLKKAGSKRNKKKARL